MAIRPVTSVSFRNNYNQVNQVNFEGKKHKENSGHRPAAMPMKAVPLAALIAMSPLSAKAQLEYNIPKTVSDKNSLIVDYSKDKELGFAEIPLGDDRRKSYMTGMLFVYDSDKDYSTCEKAEFMLVPNDRDDLWRQVVYINGLEIHHIINEVTGKEYKTEYRLAGLAADVRDPINFHNMYKMTNRASSMKVSKETFDAIKEIFGGDCPLKEKTYEEIPGYLPIF